MRCIALLVALFLTTLLHPAYAAETTYWQGGYSGLATGGDFNNSHRDFSGNSTDTFGVNGATGGMTAGYNWQVQKVVAGVEADFAGGSMNGGYNCPTSSYGCQGFSNWVGTVRPRVGVAVGQYLPYVTGGLALGENNASHPYSSIGNAIDSSQAGWTVGGGVEYGIDAMPVSVKAEYLHINIDDSNTTSVASGIARLQQDVARVGLNYKFN